MKVRITVGVQPSGNLALEFCCTRLPVGFPSLWWERFRHGGDDFASFSGGHILTTKKTSEANGKEDVVNAIGREG